MLHYNHVSMEIDALIPHKTRGMVGKTVHAFVALRLMLYKYRKGFVSKEMELSIDEKSFTWFT